MGIKVDNSKMLNAIYYPFEMKIRERKGKVGSRSTHSLELTTNFNVHLELENEIELEPVMLAKPFIYAQLSSSLVS